MDDSMRAFLTEENIEMHKEYLKKLKLKYSILEKSVIGLKDKQPYEIIRMRLERSIKQDALRLLNEISLHKCYFKSFSLRRNRSKALMGSYTSDADFRYRIFCGAKEMSTGFVYVVLDDRGVPRIRCSDSYSTEHVIRNPVLALDICEHAYFYDYGFEKDEYLRRAISYLDLSLLDNFGLDNVMEK